MAITSTDLFLSESFFSTQDAKDNFLYENVKTASSNVTSPVFRARFKNIIFPSSEFELANTPYTPIAGNSTGGANTISPFTTANDTIINTLDSTEKGLLIHTSSNGIGSTNPNLWEVTDTANFVVSNNWVNALGSASGGNLSLPNLVAEDTFKGTTLNLGSLSRSYNSSIKVTLVWTGTPSTTDTDADLNLSLQNGSQLFTPGTSFLGSSGFIGTDTVTGGAADLITGAGAVEYIEQIYIPASSSLLNEYNVYVSGTLGSVSPNTGQDFSIFFTSNPVVGQGHGWGDVHLVTFDGKAYDFQSVGEFILVKSLVDDFQVQTRQKPWGSSTIVSVNTAFATTIEGYNVVYDSELEIGQELKIDGQTYNLLSGQSVFLGTSKIERQDNSYTFIYAGSDAVIGTEDDDLVKANDNGSYIDIYVNPADYRSGLIQGLLGNGDGFSSNDFALRSGTDLGSNPSVQTIHTTYADSWRISQQESLFGKETFADKNFPSQYVTLENLTAANLQGGANANALVQQVSITEAIANAKTLVQKADIPGGEIFNAAVFDFLVTGNEQFITSSLNTFTEIFKNNFALSLAQTLVGSGINIDNPFYTGDERAAGLFNNIGLFPGIVLSTGNIDDINGPNDSDLTSTDFDTAGDADLNSLVTPSSTQDASVLEFDITPTQSFLSFQYVFASEEYNEYVNSSYNDVFGFFLTDSAGNTQNIAVIPGTNTPIAINNINSLTNSAYYRNNDTTDFGIGTTPYNTEFDGLTTVLTAVANVTPGETYHFKLAIADNSDGIYDSAVFIQSGTFTSTSLVAVNDAVTGIENTPITINVLQNDLVASELLPSIVGFQGTTTQGGTISLFNNGTPNDTTDDQLIYTPALGFSGVDTFEYSLSDGNGNTYDAVVSLEVEDNPNVLTGDDTNNNLVGTTGNDTIQGLGGDDTIKGDTGDDSLEGGTGNDSIDGESGNDTLVGGDGKDSLNGGSGSDSLLGGKGNDTYSIDNIGDIVTETTSGSAGGTDLVKASISYTLPTNVENLTLTGSTNINGTGNSASNKITGNNGKNKLVGGSGNDSITGGKGNDTLLGDNGNDTLIGGSGADSLTGGTGLDYFRFNSPSEGIDRITDFAVIDDTIQVSATSFGGSLVAGAAITAIQFTLGASATTLDHRFGYNSSNGKLWFDSDGSGATAAVQIATLNTGLALTNADIFVV